MKITVAQDQMELGKEAGRVASRLISEAIKTNGTANIILATGTSQFETLNYLIRDSEIDWSKVIMFHLDEYIGLPVTHPASFRKYLRERFISKVGVLKAVHLINGENDPGIECDRLGEIIGQHEIDVALVGIGENGHLAFNDPPADFEAREPYLVVDLDEVCRRQQYGEGWFRSIQEVPRRAISMSVGQIMKSKHIICSVPEARKATAVKNCLEKPLSNLFPASILRTHQDCSLFLDCSSAKELNGGLKLAKGTSQRDVA